MAQRSEAIHQGLQRFIVNHLVWSGVRVPVSEPLLMTTVVDTIDDLIVSEEEIDEGLESRAQGGRMIPEDEVMQDMHEGLDVVT